MKTLRIIFFTMLLFCVSVTNAQIQNEINSYVDSTEILINNGRKFLAQNVEKKDYSKVFEIYLYLKEKTSEKNCVVFNYTEDLYILALANKWEAMLDAFKNFNSLTDKYVCYPNAVSINRSLFIEISSNAEKYVEIVNSSLLTQEQKDILNIYLQLIKVGGRDDFYDKLYLSFKKKYPKSEYNDFFKSYLPAPVMSASITYYVGATQVFSDGKLSEMLSSGTAVNFGMDFCFNRYLVAMGISGGDMRILNPFSVTNGSIQYNFTTSDYFHYFNGYFDLGYFIYSSKVMRLAPFLKVGGTTIESKLFADSDDDDKEFTPVDGFVIGPGLRTEVNIHNFKQDKSNTMGLGYFSVKLDAGYNFSTKTLYPEFEGNNAYISLAIVLGIGAF